MGVFAERQDTQPLHRQRSAVSKASPLTPWGQARRSSMIQTEPQTASQRLAKLIAVCSGDGLPGYPPWAASVEPATCN